MRNSSLDLKLIVLAALVLAAMGTYLCWGLNFKFWEFALSIRIPKLLAMSLAAVCM